MKTLYFDVETTGVDPGRNGIWQLSGIMETKTSDGDVSLEEFDYKMRPLKGAKVNPQALEVGGITVEDLKSFKPEDEVYKNLVAKLDSWIDKYDPEDKFYPAGYNVQFDLNFLQAWFKSHDDYGLGSYCNWRAIDPLAIMRFKHFCGDIDLENYKLETVCKHYGIEIKAHDALSDIRATWELIYKLKEMNGGEKRGS